MAKSFNIEVKNLAAIRNAFKNSPDIISPFLRDASMESAFILERRAKELAPVASGRLRASIATSLGVANRGMSAVVSTNVNYAEPVHEGSKPHWTSVKNLESWSKQKNISPYAVQYSIATKSRKARPFMKQAVEQNQSEVQRVYEKYMNKAMQKLAQVAQ